MAAKKSKTKEDAPSEDLYDQMEAGDFSAVSTEELVYRAPDLLPGSSSPEDIFGEIYSYGRVTASAHTKVSPLPLDVGLMLRRCLRHLIRRDIKESDKFYVWNGSVWQESVIEHVREMTRQVLDALVSDTKKVRSIWTSTNPMLEPGKQGIRNVFRGRYIIPAEVNVDEMIDAELETRAKVANVLKGTMAAPMSRFLSGCELIKPDDLDANVDEVVFNTMKWSVRTGLFSPSTPDLMPTKSIGADFEEPDQEARAAFKAQLDMYEVKEETITFLKRSLGYALLGRASEKRFWWIRGITNTRKSTLLDLVYKCVGTYGQSPSPVMWTDEDKSTSHTDELSALRGARFVWSDEFKQRARFKDDLLKKVTSGMGTLRASEKKEKGFTFRPRFALFCSSNYDPYTGGDEALLARLTPVTFEKQIEVEVRDPEFSNKFVAHGKNRFAILEWLLEGAREYYEYGLPEVAEVTKARKEYVEEQASVDKQLEDILEYTGTEKSLSFSVIKQTLAEYQRRTKQTMHTTDTALGRILKKVFPETSISPDTSKRAYLGLVVRAQVMAELRSMDSMLNKEFAQAESEHDRERLNEKLAADRKANAARKPKAN